MKKIFKYPLQTMDDQLIKMPAGAVVLTIQVQQDVPCIWAEVDPVAPIIKRRFLTVGTGHPMPDVDSAHYVGTYQIQGGALVFHVYTDRKEYTE